MKNMIDRIKKITDVPIILFGVNTGHLLDIFTDFNVDVVGLDWRADISTARKILGNKAIQGNLDPALLHAPSFVIETQAGKIMAAAGKKGFIFNLGHGVTPDVKVDVLKKLTDTVHNYKYV